MYKFPAIVLLTSVLMGPTCSPPDPGPVVPVPPSPSVPPSASALFSAANKARTTKGLPTLKSDVRLDRSAQIQANDCAARGILSHQGSDGSWPWDRMKKQGVAYKAASENAAAWQTSAEQVVKDWISDPPHRDNLFNKAWTHGGSGVAKDKSGRWYWVQDYIQQ